MKGERVDSKASHTSGGHVLSRTSLEFAKSTLVSHWRGSIMSANTNMLNRESAEFKNALVRITREEFTS